MNKEINKKYGVEFDGEYVEFADMRLPMGPSLMDYMQELRKTLDPSFEAYAVSTLERTLIIEQGLNDLMRSTRVDCVAEALGVDKGRLHNIVQVIYNRDYKEPSFILMTVRIADKDTPSYNSVIMFGKLELTMRGDLELTIDESGAAGLDLDRANFKAALRSLEENMKLMGDFMNYGYDRAVKLTFKKK